MNQIFHLISKVWWFVPQYLYFVIFFSSIIYVYWCIIDFKNVSQNFFKDSPEIGNHFRLYRLQILPSDVDLNDFHGETPYYIMFGPDICGGDAHVHLIFNYKGKNLPMKNKLLIVVSHLAYCLIYLKTVNGYRLVGSVRTWFSL